MTAQGLRRPRRQERFHERNDSRHPGRRSAGIRPHTPFRRALGRLARRATAALAALAACAGLLAAGAAAHAAEGDYLTVGSSVDYRVYSYLGDTYWLGVVGYDSEGRRYYCIEHPTRTDFKEGAATTMPDSAQNRQVATLIHKYQDVPNSQDWAQSALAIVIRDAYDKSTGDYGWETARPVVKQAYPDAFERAERMKQEAVAITPDGMNVDMDYDEGWHTGTVNVRVTNAAGEAIDGVTYRVELHGPAVFVDGSTTVTGTSSASGTTLRWRATGDGEVSVTGQVNVPSIERIAGPQELVRLGAFGFVDSASLVVPVWEDLEPTIDTVTDPKVLEAGSEVTDQVTIALAGGAAWPDGATIRAVGWYFDGLTPDDLADPVDAPADGDADAMLAALKRRGFEPRGTATADFTGGAATATAMLPDGSGPYLTRADSGIGTWVWAVRRADQPDRQVASAMARDVVTGFALAAESNSTRAQPTVETSAWEHSTHVGASLGDTITVAGFPADHGSFEGDGEVGLRPDTAYAKVRVWWAGSGDGTDDGPYVPSGDEEPEEDEHHRLVGEWQLAAANGTYRFGGGAPDATGEPVRVLATEPGWYVFVWSFAGDDRARPAAGSYADEWERVYVAALPSTQSATAETPSADPTPSPEPTVEPAAEPEPEPQIVVADAHMPIAQTGASPAMAIAVAVVAAVLGLVILGIRRRWS
ncbi:MAG: hypothetical protein UHD09_06405 [Bifidobacterium sp.]|nr:hypothetical protein [Bifidobacterium sp.]